MCVREACARGGSDNSLKVAITSPESKYLPWWNFNFLRGRSRSQVADAYSARPARLDLRSSVMRPAAEHQHV